MGKISDQQAQAYFDQRVPYSRFEYVNVTFNASANVDTDIPHSLSPSDPEIVRWEVVSLGHTAAAGVIYKDTSATRKAWQTTHIYLRSTVASVTARLRLFLE